MEPHSKNKHHDQIASVQYNEGISVGEKEFLHYRLPIVKKAIEEKFKHPITKEQIPSVAIMGSGGGYRAMLYFTALLASANKAHILDTVTYISALSGSTWALAPWITTGKPIAEFKTYIQQCAAKHFCDITHEEKKFIADKIITKTLHNKRLTLVDIYGELLGNRLLESLGDSKYTAVLSDQIGRIEDGRYPYPIYIAIDGRNEKAAIENPTVYACTPHTTSEHTNFTEIPSWADDRKYKCDKSTNLTPEKNLAYDLGTWGSAFGASIHDILNNLFNDYPEILKIIEKMLKPIDGDRIIPCYAVLPNYLYKTNHKTHDQTLRTDKTMIRVDAGLHCNLPFAPLSGICSERIADILIVVDISAGEIGSELKKVVDYAKTHNLPFPTIDFTNINKRTISIFKDENNKTIPTVIYMPRISDPALWEINKDNPEFKNYNLSGFDLDHETNDGFAKTIHFHYTLENSTMLMNQASFNFHVNEDKIWEEIKWKVNQKS